MPKRYTIIENPPPYTQGLTTTSSFNTQIYKPIVNQRFSNKLIDNPSYNIIQAIPPKLPGTVVNSTIINQEITIVNQGNNKLGAQYIHTNPISNINTRTQLINNGGLATYDDNPTPIWSTTNNKLLCTVLKEFIQVVINIKCSTNTLGGAFEIEANNGTVLHIIESNITIQNQDFNIEFNIITDQNCVTNGLQFFISPELGMNLNISNFSLLIIKG